MHDLHHIADLVEKGVKSSEPKKAAGEVKKDFNEAIIANEASSKYSGSKGLSIYAPTMSGSSFGYGYNKLQFAKDTQWDKAIVKAAMASKKTAINSEQPDTLSLWPDKSEKSKKAGL